jgi:integrase
MKKQMPKQTHLHNRRGTYYFRCRVPVDLLDYYAPKKEISRSLKTKDYKQALKLVRTETVRQDEEFSRVRDRNGVEGSSSLETQVSQPIPLSREEIQRLADIHKWGILAKDEITSLGEVEGRSLEEQGKHYSQELLRHREALAQRNLAIVQNEVDLLLLHHNHQINKETPTYKALSLAVLNSTISALVQVLARLKGEAITTPNKPEAIKRGPKLSEVFEGYKTEKERAGTSKKTLQDAGSKIGQFIKLHGNLHVEKITKAHVRGFKEHLLNLGGENNRRLNPKTIREKYLAFLRTVLNWAENNGFIDSNPADGISLPIPRNGKTTRLPFSIQDLNIIFCFPVFTQNERPRGGGGEAAKWIPLLALFTGARLEELGQLLVSDIKQEGDIHFLDMTVIEEGKHYKTQSSRRKVPLHSQLIGLGFLEYVHERRAAGDTRLFPEVKSNLEQTTAAWSKWWGRYSREHGINDSRKVFHSFRHTVKDALREAGVETALNDAVMGHTQGSVGGRYGSGYSLRAMAEAVEKIHYHGLELGHIRKTK